MRVSSKQMVIYDWRSLSKHPVHYKQEKQAYMEIFVRLDAKYKNKNLRLSQWKKVDNTVCAVPVQICCK